MSAPAFQHSHLLTPAFLAVHSGELRRILKPNKNIDISESAGMINMINTAVRFNLRRCGWFVNGIV